MGNPVRAPTEEFSFVLPLANQFKSTKFDQNPKLNRSATPFLSEFEPNYEYGGFRPVSFLNTNLSSFSKLSSQKLAAAGSMPSYSFVGKNSAIINQNVDEKGKTYNLSGMARGKGLAETLSAKAAGAYCDYKHLGWCDYSDQYPV